MPWVRGITSQGQAQCETGHRVTASSDSGPFKGPSSYHRRCPWWLIANPVCVTRLGAPTGGAVDLSPAVSRISSIIQQFVTYLVALIHVHVIALLHRLSWRRFFVTHLHFVQCGTSMKL